MCVPHINTSFGDWATRGHAKNKKYSNTDVKEKSLFIIQDLI